MLFAPLAMKLLRIVEEGYSAELRFMSLPVGFDPGLDRPGVKAAQTEPRTFRQQPAMQARQVAVPLD